MAGASNDAASDLSRITAALHALPLGLAIVELGTDDSARLISANPAYLALTDGGGGVSLCERLFMPDRQTPLTTANWPGALAITTQCQLADCELHLYCANDSWRVLSLNATPVAKTETDSSRRAVLTVRVQTATVDVGRLNRIEAELARSHNELQTVIEKLPIGVFFSRGGKFLYANPTFLGYLGLTSVEQVIGRGADAVLIADEVAIGRAYALPQNQPFRAMPAREWSARHASGRVVTLRSEPTREISLDGERAILWMITDITAIKQMQAQLLSADRLASLGMLSAGVAHEINNPLTYVIGALEQAFDLVANHDQGEMSAAISAAIAEAQAGAERVRGVVSELKTFSRDDGRLVPVDVRKLINAALHMTANEVRPRARVITELEACPLVIASEVQLGQVFLNLIINAVQAIPEGNVEQNEIRISASTDSRGRCVVEVRDTGGGISPLAIERIFDPFFTTKPVGIGTGLGLSICRNTVTAIGGEISATSELGRGSAFRVVLPPAAVAAVVHKPVIAAIVKPSAPRDDGQKRGRVLVVDDEEAIGRYVKRTLAGDHEVTVLNRAREARDRIVAGERFDAIVCDLMMPEMTGMDFYAEIESLVPELAPQIILLTGGAFTPRASEFLDRVPNRRLFKPFSAAELRDLVRAVVDAKPMAPS